MLQVDDLMRILAYINRGPGPVTDDLIRSAVRRFVPNPEERVMGLFGGEWLQKGLQQGQAKQLTRLLEKRFGVLPPCDRENIISADVASVERWFERAIDAPDLRSVFEST